MMGWHYCSTMEEEGRHWISYDTRFRMAGILINMKKGLIGCDHLQCSSNNHLICAERRFIAYCVQIAHRHGVPSHRIGEWIHRKGMGHIAVVRWKMDGTYGCSVPCAACRRELIRYGIRVRCFMANGTWYDGRMDDPNAPPSKLFSGGVRSNIRQ